VQNRLTIKQSAKESLGDHELTCICYKLLGDLYIENEEALLYYSEAIKLRKNLQLDSNEPFVYLLKNYGSCLFYCDRFKESVETLHEARIIAEKIGEKRPCTANVYFALTRTFLSWKPKSQEAAKCAKALMEVKDLVASHYVKDIHIFEAAEKIMAKEKSEEC
jgi:tetratricopeptide (TPR) repeat protein